MSSDDNHDDKELPTPLSVQQIEDFWREFVRHQKELKTLSDHDFVNRTNEILQPFAPDLALEHERSKDSDTSLLVVTAHGNIDQFENIQAMARHAPQMPGYKVQAFRSRALGSDFSMGMDGFTLACSDVLVAHYDAGGNVGLELSFEKIIPADMRDHARHMAFIMLDHVLGEWDFAVRVGPVEFVDAFSDEVAGAEPLSVFPPIFDAFIREDLGRTYRMPSEENDRWVMLEMRQRGAPQDAPPDLLTFRASANALATRADLSHFLELRFAFESQEDLDEARDAQDALNDELERLHGGLLVFTRVEQMRSRVAGYYVVDVDSAKQLAARVSAQHAPNLKPDIAVTFDPSWQEYLAFYSAVHPAEGNDDDEDDDE